jgi:hypothetical protein
VAKTMWIQGLAQLPNTSGGAVEPRNSAASASRRKSVSSRAYAERVSSAYSSTGVRPEYALQHSGTGADGWVVLADPQAAAGMQQLRVDRMPSTCTASQPGYQHAKLTRDVTPLCCRCCCPHIWSAQDLLPP